MADTQRLQRVSSFPQSKREVLESKTEALESKTEALESKAEALEARLEKATTLVLASPRSEITTSADILTSKLNESIDGDPLAEANRLDMLVEEAEGADKQWSAKLKELVARRDKMRQQAAEKMAWELLSDKVSQILQQRVSDSEQAMLTTFFIRLQKFNPKCNIDEILDLLLRPDDQTVTQKLALGPYVSLHTNGDEAAGIEVDLGYRYWPPSPGYSFACWIQVDANARSSPLLLPLFSVASTDARSRRSTEIILVDDELILKTDSSSSSFSCHGLRNGAWHHLVVVFTKPNLISEIFLSSGADACMYIDGIPSLPKKNLPLSQLDASGLVAVIGMPISSQNVGNLSWKLRSCYLFEDVLTLECVSVMYLLGQGYKGIFQDKNLPRFFPHPIWRPTIGWNLENLSGFCKNLSRKKMLLALDPSYSEDIEDAYGVVGIRLLNLVAPVPIDATSAILQFGRLYGQITVEYSCQIGDSIRPMGGIAVILAFVKVAKTKQMLVIALSLLAGALRQDHLYGSDMKKHKGYQILAMLLRPKMADLFDMEALSLVFQIAACQDSDRYIVSNSSMIEHVLLDWTLWEKAPRHIKEELVRFFDSLDAKHKDHNYTVLRKSHFSQHLSTLRDGVFDQIDRYKLTALCWGLGADSGVISRSKVLRADTRGRVLSAETAWKSLLRQIPICESFGTQDQKWQLCLVEGPHRMRKKLERANSRICTMKDILDDESMILDEVSTSDLESLHDALEQPSHAIDLSDMIRSYMEHLEEIQCQYNCELVTGTRNLAGIFIIGEHCLYFIENLMIEADGCICIKTSKDAPSAFRQHLGVPKKNEEHLGVTKVVDNNQLSYLCRVWKKDRIQEIYERDYWFLPLGIEIETTDHCNDLLLFLKGDRDVVYKNLSTGHHKANISKLASSSTLQDWRNGIISNFEYLMDLNTRAGRGYTDMSRYPVFPWVVSDYRSEALNLNDSNTFRDLGKPMGCLTLDREAKADERYEDIGYHHTGHYSNSPNVLHYLVRLPPFSAEHKEVYGHNPDRLFRNIQEQWVIDSAASSGTLVSELVPEFFYLPEFLKNGSKLDLGVKQNGEKVDDDVVLPPWANGSIREFILKNRQALESQYVSEHLHKWIDLIFGYKQSGAGAIEARNLFFPEAYKSDVDVYSCKDNVERDKLMISLRDFGQCPTQVFDAPHEERQVTRPPRHPLKDSANLIPVTHERLPGRIRKIDMGSKRLVIISEPNTLRNPESPLEWISWGSVDSSLRFNRGMEVIAVHENLHGGKQIMCVTVSRDFKIVVTGASDGLICVWNILDGYGLEFEKALCSHRANITCLHVSREYMQIVSASSDGIVILWDLCTLEFTRQLPKFPDAVSSLFVNDLTGDFVTATKSLLAVWSINGDCLAMIDSLPSSDPPLYDICCVTSCTCSDWLARDWFATGHEEGAIAVWQMIHRSAEELKKRSAGATSSMTRLLNLDNEHEPEYRLVLRNTLDRHRVRVTALHMGDIKQLVSGDELGNLVSWKFL